MRSQRTHAKKRPARRGASPEATVSKFERLLKDGSAIQHYSLSLFVTGTTARSSQAVANIRALCDEYLQGRYDLEVVDIYQQPSAAMDQQIVAAPTLIKRRPVPLKRIVGDLSDREKVILGLNLRRESDGKSSKWETL